MKTTHPYQYFALAATFLLIVCFITQNLNAQDIQNVTLVGQWANGVCEAIDARNDTAYFGNGGALQIVDFTDPENPNLLGQVACPSLILSVKVKDNLVAVGMQKFGLRLIDISDISNPTILSSSSSFTGYSSVTDIEIINQYLYFVDNRLNLFDISNPAAPVNLGQTEHLSIEMALTIQNDYAFIGTSGDGVQIVDIEDPSNPQIISEVMDDTLQYGLRVCGVSVRSDTLYIADGSKRGLRVVDISDIYNPQHISFLYTGGNASGLCILDDYAYLQTWSELHIIDISDGSHPTEIWTLETISAFDVALGDQNTLFIADYSGGAKEVDITDPLSAEFTGQYNTAGWAEDIAVQNDYAYVPSDELYVLDISNPSNPIEIGVYAFGDEWEWARSIDIQGDKAYIATDSKSMSILDISNPANLTQIGSLDFDEHLMDIKVRDNYAFLSGKALRVIDISDPTDPIEEYSMSTVDSRQIAFYNNHLLLAGKEGLRIFDITNPTNPEEIASVLDNELILSVDVEDNYAYVTQFWDSLKIFNITSPSDPVLVGSMKTLSGPFNVTVQGEYAYIANGGWGFRVVDISDPENPEEVGWYETGEDAWHVTVSHGLILVADRMDGVFIFTNDLNTSIEDPLYSEKPSSYLVFQNYPNPFNPTTTISFNLPKSGKISLKILDILGREIETLSDGFHEAGQHQILWHAGLLPSGTYLVRLKSGDFVDTKKLVLQK